MKGNLTIQRSDLNMTIQQEEGGQVIQLQGSLDTNTTGTIWQKATESILQQDTQQIKVDCQGISYCDGTGIGFLYHIQQIARKKEVSYQFTGLSEIYQQLLQQFPEEGLNHDYTLAPPRLNRVEKIGFHIKEILYNLNESISFLGELFIVFLTVIHRPVKIRWKDFWRVAEDTGVNAFPIIALIGFLLGLIMSFQSAIPMQRFGAEIFVANLVSISLFRELGPLMTGVILAGRTASSFAAELGTMKINEEIDAFTTMGLYPLRFLVVPRLLAAFFVTPFLTIFFNLFGLVGSAIVIMSFDYPLITFINQVIRATGYGDLLSGLFKAMVFGLLVAGIGCFQGLKTGTGASAVGESTTKSVVSGIIIIAITDGVFSVMFFYLGI